jgi:hypothetical protein
MNLIVDFASVSEEFKELLKEYLKLFQSSPVQQWPLLFFIYNNKKHDDTSWVNDIDRFVVNTISVDRLFIYSTVTCQSAFPSTLGSLTAALNLFNNQHFHIVSDNAEYLQGILSNPSKIIPKVRASAVKGSEVNFLTRVIAQQKKSDAEMKAEHENSDAVIKAAMDANLKLFRESNSPSHSPSPSSPESFPS